MDEFASAEEHERILKARSAFLLDQLDVDPFFFQSGWEGILQILIRRSPLSALFEGNSEESRSGCGHVESRSE
jgi:hypothetical protein